MMDAHENARKGAVTDALKSALRGYGEQFGNSLYGDGMKAQQASRPVTVEQLKHIKAFCERLNREPPQGDISYADADKLLHELV